MSKSARVAAILARTARRKREGANQYYPQHAREPGQKPEPTRKKFALPTCRYFGPKLAGEPCGSTLHRCTLDGAVCSRFTACAEADRVCATCTLRPPS